MNDGLENSAASDSTESGLGEPCPLAVACRPARIAFVPPRFGPNLGGGAETLVADLAKLLSGAKLSNGTTAAEVEIWTTSAKDHRTWDNFYPEGSTVEEGITVRRFAVDPRDLEKFIGAEVKLAEGRELSVDEQLSWIENSVNSSGLYRHIAQNGRSFDRIVFAPYLFGTTFWGALLLPERSVLLPCLHDEAYAYLPIFAHLTRAVGGLIFNAEPEQELAAVLYPRSGILKKSSVVGMSFAPGRPAAGAQLPGGLAPGSYLLYSGRKERGKNLDLAIDYFTKFAAARAGSANQDGNGPVSRLKLVLIGSGSIDFLDFLPETIFDLGFVSEEEKAQLMANSLALLQPSTNESFSIVLMESWLAGRPVLVNGHCPVTKYHVEQSGGGLFFNDYSDFAAAVGRLAGDPGMADDLGGWGRRYVLEQYSPAAVLARTCRALGISLLADSDIQQPA